LGIAIMTALAALVIAAVAIAFVMLAMGKPKR
jgi:hypothetical protein